MRLLSVCALLASTAALSASAAGDGVIVNEKPLPPIPPQVPRGVLRSLVDSYTAAFSTVGEGGAKKVFTCLDGTQTILADRVNDEYCDCKDGSDEPGTSACSLETINKKDWRFRCTDSGSQFKDRTFRHSQVNDGICDCCDGSDEYAGHMACPNTCAELAAEEDKAHSEREEKRRLGLEAKKKMEQEVLEKIKKAQQTVEENEQKVKEAEARLEELKKRKEEAEQAEVTAKEEMNARHLKAVEAWKADKAKRLAQPEFQKPMWACVRWAQTRNCKGDGEMDELNRTCDFVLPSAASGFCVCRKRTEEYLAKIRNGSVNVKADAEKREAELKATAEGEGEKTELEVEPQIDDDDDERPEDDRINPSKYPELYNQQQEERLVGVVAEDTLLRYDCGHSPFTCEEMCEYGGNEELKKMYEENYNGDTKEAAEYQTPEATAARADFQRVESEIRDAQNRANDAKKTLAALQQEDITPAFRSMNGLCYERQFHNYKYSFCPFRQASQDHTSLGTWVGFGEQTYSSWGAKHDFSIMKFEGGTQCWGGPQRSLTVRVVCGPDNAILSVEEPSMCAYRLKFQTPAICE